MPVVGLDLVLDVGNTRTKLALFQGDRLVKHGPMANHDRVALAAFVGDVPLQGIGLGSTATPDPAFVEHLGTWAPTTVLTGTSPSPLRNAYGTPHTLGADRLANAVGAVRHFPGRTVLVFDLGTCLTYRAEDDERPTDATFYVPLWTYASNDEVTRLRIREALARRGLPTATYEAGLRTVARRPLEIANGIHTYCSMKLVDGRPRITVYWSPELYSSRPPECYQRGAEESAAPVA